MASLASHTPCGPPISSANDPAVSSHGNEAGPSKRASHLRSSSLPVLSSQTGVPTQAANRSPSRTQAPPTPGLSGVSNHQAQPPCHVISSGVP